MGLTPEPDLVLLTGDNIYGKAPVESDDSSAEQKLARLYTAYETMAANPSVRRGLSKIPVIATLDDNDYCGLQDAAKRLFSDRSFR